MKIFISYSGKDFDSAKKVRDSLDMNFIDGVYMPDKDHVDDLTKSSPFASELLGYEDKAGNIFSSESQSKSFSKTEKMIIESDVSIILFGENFRRGFFTEREMHTILTDSVLNPRKKVVIFTLDLAKRPFDFEPYPLVVGNDDLDGGIAHLHKLLKQLNAELNTESSTETVAEAVAYEVTERNSRNIDSLSKSFTQGELTLVVGAGISVEAKMPSWDDLLDDMLQKLIVKHMGQMVVADGPKVLEEIKENSSLIIGQYLKNSLGDDFIHVLRSSLYRGAKPSSSAINAICRMAKPRRAGNDLESIVTFNFDDLLEQNFSKQGVQFKSIYQEGVRADANQIPIYHVHGFLPKEGEISEDMGIVFSEDAYHDQFIDPFSWSNLIQLSKFGQNTCLFVGLSLSDPNLRRLLDVSNRKEPTAENRHYVIQKRNDSSPRGTLIERFREGDANALGIGVIWVTDYSEIPEILDRISQ